MRATRRAVPAYPANEKKNRAALARVRALTGSDPDSPTGRELAEWVRLVEAYEEKHFDPGAPGAVDAIRFFLEERGLRQRDLAPYVGSAVRASEILARKRPLTLAMIHRPHECMGIPAELLIVPCRPAPPPIPRASVRPVPPLAAPPQKRPPSASIPVPDGIRLGYEHISAGRGALRWWPWHGSPCIRR